MPTMYSRCTQFDRSRTAALSAFTLDNVHEVGKKPLGVGSYGEVVELEYRGLKCAGKKLHSIFIDEQQPEEHRLSILRRFQDECTILSRLRHPNIVQFLGVCYQSDDKIPILVMELLLMNLTSCVDKYGILPNEVAYSILHDVALGLSYLHGFEEPIVHRDLSANNIMLTTDMRAKIADLGVARILNLDYTRLTQNPGTQVYMPPEALSTNPHYTTAIDVYSFGVLILHIFSGQWPVPSDAIYEDPNSPSSRPIARTEEERREMYFRQMGSDHPLAELAKHCIQFKYARRPRTKDLLLTIESKLDNLPAPLFHNKVQTVLWQKHLHSEIERLQTSVALLRGGITDDETDTYRLGPGQRPEAVAVATPGPSFGCRLEASFDMSSITTSGTLTTASSNISSAMDIPDSGSYVVPHPCQPGAKLQLSTGSNLPVAMYNAQAVVIRNKVYVGGGSTRDKKNDSTIFCYDETDPSWSLLSPECPVVSFGLALINGKVATVGGRTVATRGITNKVYTYDNSNPGWKPVNPPMPTARHSLTVVNHDSNVFACGGKDGEGISDAVEVFVVCKNQWFVTYPLPFPFYQMSSTVIHGTCYLLGGYDRFAFTDKVVYASLSTLLKGRSTTSAQQSPWKRLTPTRHNCATAANLGGCLLAIGGSIVIGGSRIDLFSQHKNAWVKLTEFAGHDTCLAPTIAGLPNGTLLIIGGATSSLEPRNSMYMAKIVYH